MVDGFLIVIVLLKRVHLPKQKYPVFEIHLLWVGSSDVKNCLEQRQKCSENTEKRLKINKKEVQKL